MSAQWTGEVIGKMHVHKIKMAELASEIGWHEKYLSTVLNGHREPKDAEPKVRAALERMIAQNDE